MFKRQRSAHSDGAGMTLVEHLAELRRRIIISVLALALGVVVGFYYSSPMVQFLLRLPGELVYLYPGEAFFVHLEVALVVGIVLSSPVVLYQVVRFIAPGLLAQEKRILQVGLPAALLMFAGGTVFAYQVILPLAYRFFLGFGTESLTPMISIGNYVSFVIRLVLPFGLVFQLPLIVLLFTSIGILSPEILVKYRKYIVLVVFITAAVLTPPDVISQTFMAVPMVLLYEVSILLARMVVRRRKARRG
ncbi:MAG: twin-arginine translocase subunit TatC [Limnochordia bacterium]|jgi:sec-independent protein translocase protein TatC|nr:twin-arginine translocase subunit TatC [Limnochordia bacterium]MDI9465662.1 twin-arginine translocase subunit TatC [Bacillota bacterium]NLO95549.1 twin-arginine translocase subunit TatC [Bacillota bacterium]HOB40965.1 twin-arginine translocase subunit TatC [Limnochordia bacterium]HOK31227.1 twin-arginine translocase subunit TatC [Limnochordia bacterium]